MGIAQGYSKIATNGLVFTYDTGDPRNSYKGKPAYNVIGDPYPWVGNNNANYDPGYFFYTSVGTETVNIPALGTYNNVQYATINNGYTGYGTGGNYNCCPSLFRYGTWGVSTGVSGNTLYTYSIIYKCQSGYYNPNYMYHYEYGPSGYLTEFGVFDPNKRVDLGDGWYWAYNTFTTQPTCTTIYPGMWYYQYNTPDKVWVLSSMLVQGDYKIPPLNFLSAYETRSNTQGLLDISGGGSTLNLSNISYDSNAQITFDGSSNYISVPSFNPSSYTGLTLNVIAKINSSSSSWVRFFDFGNGANNNNLLLCRYAGTNNIFFGVYNGGASNYATGGTLQFDQYAMYTGVADGTNFKIYVNGILASTVTDSTIPVVANRTSNFLGKSNWADPYLNGNINVAQIYNRALSAGEVLANFNHYKTRFNIT